jgi:hypothetical protein
MLTVRRTLLYLLVQSLTSDAEAGESCFQDYTHESLTGPGWYDQRLEQADERHSWWQTRQLFEPIVGESTAIAGVLYSHSKSTLKMTVLFPPLYPEENRFASVVVTRLSRRRRRELSYSIPCEIKETTWHCTARLDRLPSKRNYRFRVVYQPDPSQIPSLEYEYWGHIPAQASYPKIAAMGCFGADTTWKKPELQAAVLAERPDLLILQGDQSYLHYNIASGFLELVYSINNITRSVPTLVQMDDHDYGMPNFWGAGSKAEDSGSGFDKPACVINALQSMALSHLPDPATNSTLENGIDVKFTSYLYGNVDFAILEARKFKNLKGDSLLGSEQEDWLKEKWCNQNAGAVKVVLAQTPFASLATNATNFYVNKGRIDTVNVSIDSNGNPLEGRRRFMEIAQDCAPLILSGDQHIGIAVTYEDYGVSECASPAVVNDVLYVCSEGPYGSRSP